MNRKRLGFFALLSVALLFAATDPVLAQSSVNEKLINGLNSKLLWVGVPITILVEGILFYAVWKFRDNDDPTPTQENRRLELTWTVATAVILLFVGLSSFLVMGSQFVAPAPTAAQDIQGPQAQQQTQPAITMENKSGAIAPPAGSNALQVEIDGVQWQWIFNYPTTSTHANFSSTGTMVLPANRTIYFHIISSDVLHSVNIPALNIKQDAFPGQYNTVETNISQTGTYQLYCTEYCGAGHSRMIANTTVVSQQAYQSWASAQSDASSGGSSGSSAGAAGGNSSTNASAGGSGNASAGNNSAGSANASTGNNSAGNASASNSSSVAAVAPRPAL